MSLILFLFLPIIILYLFELITFRTIITTIYIIYCLPKIVVIELLELFFPKVITRNTTSRFIALTFDDVPYGSHQEIIKILDENNMKGTFFIISSDVNETNIDSLIMAVRSGHQLANHGKTNSMHFLKKSKDLKNEIIHCDTLIREIYQRAGVSLPIKMFYRPGCGVFGFDMLRIVDSLGYKLALGSVYPNDPLIRIPSINLFYLKNHIESGDVVILHDRSWTPETLRKLMIWLNRINLESVTMDNLFRTI
ncbi:polysaccharide deacetylase [Tupanvirus soda lake]|uniref:Polysaccharide deacetylase n=2 Tax=Tupanvirus TaxID=2094720 RepID=A0A6N1NXD2_9VIRU|nr:polysaccharide deacetylase [Tupanvirus soda lake]QKU35916.1 polysaccharide deacetylase [Tupanvirus soda lake]